MTRPIYDLNTKFLPNTLYQIEALLNPHLVVLPKVYIFLTEKKLFMNKILYGHFLSHTLTDMGPLKILHPYNWVTSINLKHFYWSPSVYV